MGLILGGGFFWKNKNSTSKKDSLIIENTATDNLGDKEADTALTVEEQQMKGWLEKCEAGEEIVLSKETAEKKEEISGKIEIDYLDDNDSSGEYFLTDENGKKQKFSATDQANIDLLEGRRVVLAGEWKNGIFFPTALRCANTLQEKNKLEDRRKIMAEAADKVEEISGKKGKFVVESFWWQNDEYFYMDFFDEDDEDIFYEVLVYVSQKEGKNVFERAAFFQSSGEDGDLELVSGRDLFEDSDVNESSGEDDYYEYDDILKAWSPVY